MISIYLKTHNETGLKYLGKTIKDPYEYNGSGVYWKNHLKKHGNNVSTEILFASNDASKIKKMGIHFSKLWNIVDNSDFANLMEENGVGGITSTSWKKGQAAHNKGKKMPSVSEAKKAWWDQWKLDNPGYKDKWKKYIPVENPKRVDNTSALNKTVIECPHCGKTGNVGNMKRWHYDRCNKR